ncbi:MAG: GNAT family protein [Pseudomonadota bacterium]
MPPASYTTSLGEPIGAPVFDFKAPPLPPEVPIEGRLVRLEPLSASAHGASLYAALQLDPEGADWTYRMQEPPESRTAFTGWLETLETHPSMRYFAYVNRATGHALGKGAFMEIDAANGVIEIGSIILTRAMQRMAVGTEALTAMISWAFEAGYRRVEWTCDPLNAASCAAAERLGFSYEACFAQAYVTKGRNRDKAIFAATDGDWPALRTAYAAWLHPGNFDDAGQQRQSLSALTAPLLRARAPAATSPRLNALAQPIGGEVANWIPPPPPPRAPMAGRFCRLEPLEEHHAPDLFDALAEDREGRVFTYMPNGPFDSLESYLAWLRPARTAADPLQFAILVEGRAVGTASYLRIAPEHGSIEVGYITFSPRLQRTIAATEAMALMMREAFALGYRRYEWKCNACNAPSRRAAQRLGFSFEGVFAQAQIVKSHNRDTAWYAITDDQWPALSLAFESWLAPHNFDEEGRQRQSLSSLTRPLLKATE